MNKRMAFFIFSTVFSLLFALLLTTNSYAKTIVVTDIDDTLKSSQVRSLISRSIFAFQDDFAFLGMADLLNEVLRQNSDSKVYYVTNAPAWLMQGSHKRFLKNNGFPKGEVLFRDESVELFKYNAIARIIADENPDQVILIGDNGERDVISYDAIFANFAEPHRRIYQFIRMAYEQLNEVQIVYPTTEDQIGFATPIEIAMHLHRLDVLPETSTTDYVRDLAVQVLADAGHESGRGPHSFYNWVSCGDLVLDSNLVQKWSNMLTEIKLYQSFLQTRCF